MPNYSLPLKCFVQRMHYQPSEIRVAKDGDHLAGFPRVSNRVTKEQEECSSESLSRTASAVYLSGASDATYGLVTAFVTMRLMSSILFHVSPVEPIAYATITIGVIAVAYFACYLLPVAPRPSNLCTH
jgi:hypothetical protein